VEEARFAGDVVGAVALHSALFLAEEDTVGAPSHVGRTLSSRPRVSAFAVHRFRVAGIPRA